MLYAAASLACECPRGVTDLELEALRQIAVHPATRHIPYRVQFRLKDIGYAKEVLGGLVLTDDGFTADCD